MGGELGHMVIVENGRECTCGRRGCLEAYASATALIEKTKEKMEADKDSKLWEVCQGQLKRVNGASAFKAALRGDKAAREVIDEFTGHLATGIVSAVNILQPEIVAIGGGLSGSADEIVPIINQRLKEEAFSRHYGTQTEVVKASLGNDAGIIGAAMLWKNKRK